jgi:hypothetical protein
LQIHAYAAQRRLAPFGGNTDINKMPPSPQPMYIEFPAADLKTAGTPLP